MRPAPCPARRRELQRRDVAALVPDLFEQDKKPLADAVKFAGFLQNAVSGSTLPPHVGVLHYPIPMTDQRGFVATFVPPLDSSPVQALKGGEGIGAGGAREERQCQDSNRLEKAPQLWHTRCLRCGVWRANLKVALLTKIHGVLATWNRLFKCKRVEVYASVKC